MPQLIILGGGPRRVFTAISAAQLSSASFTFSGLSLGDVLPSRQIIVGVAIETSGTNFAINSLTVAGIAATSVIQKSQDDTFSKSRAALFRIANSVDAAANVAVSLAGSVSRCQVGVWAAYDLANAAPSFTASDGDSDGNPSALAIDMAATGLLFALGVVFGGTGTQTLSGMATIDASENTSHKQWGSYQAGAPETGRAVGFSGAAGADSARALVAMSWS